MSTYMVNLVNTILSNASADYQARVPQATQTNLSEIRTAILESRDTENEFLSALVNKIAYPIIWSRTFKNPLAILKKGSIPYGKNLEEIYTNPAKAEQFDPTGSTLLNRRLPDTKAIYHTLNRQDKYVATVSKSQLIQAFTSYQALEELLNTIINTIYSGDNFDEYLLMKQLFAEGITGNMLKTMSVANLGSTDNAKAFVKALKTVGKNMETPSSLYNAYYDLNSEKDAKPIITWTPADKQIIIMRNDVSVDVDVELLARSMNVSYAELQQRILTVDSFGSATNCGAILCDEGFVRVYENLKQAEEFRNPDGLYTNFILHHWQTYGLSLFANAMAFTFEPETE